MLQVKVGRHHVKSNGQGKALVAGREEIPHKYIRREDNQVDSNDVHDARKK